jgi:hypothetical protein
MPNHPTVKNVRDAGIIFLYYMLMKNIKFATDALRLSKDETNHHPFFQVDQWPSFFLVVDP